MKAIPDMCQYNEKKKKKKPSCKNTYVHSFVFDNDVCQ